MQQAISGLATVALEQTRREVELALRRPPGIRPFVMRVTAVGNEQRIAHIRKRLRQILKELRDQKSEKKRLRARDSQRWTLTIAFVPRARG